MQELSPQNVTLLLQQASNGDAQAMENLFPVVYQELKKLAGYHFKKERNNHTLQPTALVHEAYLKLIQQKAMSCKSRAHFFSIASQLMRRILIDYARQKHARKRGKNESPSVVIKELYTNEELELSDLLAIDHCLLELKKQNERLHQLVEFKFFGGMSIEQIAEAMETSPATVKRDWSLAKAWLYRELSRA